MHKELKNNSLNLITNKQEGAYIRYKLSLKKYSLAKVGRIVGCCRDLAARTVKGERSSIKVRLEIARILGHECWDDVLLEARLACSGNFQPTKSDIESLKQNVVDSSVVDRAKAFARCKDVV